MPMPPRAQQGGEFGLGGETLAGGDGDRAVPRDLGEVEGRVGGDRLLEPERVIGRDAAGEPDGPGGRELAVGAEEQVGVAADGLAQRPAEGFGAVEIGDARLMAAEDGIGPRGIELQRGEALGDHPGPGFGRRIGVGVEACRVLIGARIDVGIAAQPVTEPPPPEGMDRPVMGLAENVPAGDLEARKGAHHRGIGPLGEPGGIGAAEHPFDVLGRLPLHVAREHVSDHGAHGLRADGRGIDLAPADDAAGGGELHEDEIAPAETRRRVAHHQNVEIGELHGAASKTMTLRRARPDRVASIASLMRASG